MRASRWLVVGMAAFAALAGGCGGGGEDASTQRPSTTTAPVTVVDGPLPPIVAMDAAGAKAIQAGTRADEAAWISAHDVGRVWRLPL